VASAGATWSTGQLAEFVAAMSASADVAVARQSAVERAAEAFGAEAGAIIAGDVALASIGFPHDGVPHAALAAAAAHGDALDVPGVGACEILAAPVDAATVLLVARDPEEEFTHEEMSLLRAMGRVLSLSLRTLAVLEDQRERGALLERLTEVQRSVVDCDDLPDTLSAIARGAATLLGAEAAGVRLDGRLAAWHGPTDRPPVLAAALHDEQGPQGGTLVVAPRADGRPYADSERDVLRAFAEHTSLALTNARNHASAVHRALHDPLTGLANRALFRERLDHALARCSRLDKDVAVLFVDVDDFKAVNDQLGHAHGDELLLALADRLRTVLRAEDTPARLGGDEFAVLIEDVTDAAEAVQVAERLLVELERPVRIAGQDVTVGASVGIATGRRSGDDLLRNADFAMYQAKADGRGHYALFEADMHAAALRRLSLTADLRRALDRDELFLHYQPIVRVRTGEICGVEALVRWRHPEHGVIPPGDFIPLAEQQRLIVPIGRWVLQEACREGAAWHRRWPELRVGVNVSGVQMADPALVEDIEAALADSGMAPECLVLELTETVLMQDVEATAERLHRIRRLGPEISVDDFGTGYTSLQYLQHFPIDSMKVARTFIDGLDGTTDRSKLARAIVDLGLSLGMIVIGEGVERPEQLAALNALGCDFAQGFLLARPMPAESLTALLAQPVRTALPTHAA
jgi:diguanylate cyclase (GGDEF)-like protein